MKKRLLAIIATAAMVVTMIPSMVFATVEDPCTQSPCTHVAKVGTAHYDGLQEAIIAAAPSGTVEILKNVTVEEWKMFAESMTHTDIITLNINGITINGNGKTLTVKKVVSGSNGGYLFYSAKKLNINDLTISLPNGGGVGLKSGILNNVTFDGGNGVYPGTGEVAINDCVFKTKGQAVYYEEARDNLTVSNCTFDVADGANIIILRGKEVFKDNTINSGRTVNIAASGSPEVSGNKFNNDVRLKVYNDATATIFNNTVSNLVFEDASVPKSEFVGNTLSAAAEATLKRVGGENKPAPAPTPEPTPEAKPAAKPDNSPNTGDNSMAPIAVAGLALAAMASYFSLRIFVR